MKRVHLKAVAIGICSTAVILSCVSPGQAGVIPWLYQAIFGPVGTPAGTASYYGPGWAGSSAFYPQQSYYQSPTCCRPAYRAARPVYRPARTCGRSALYRSCAGRAMYRPANSDVEVWSPVSESQCARPAAPPAGEGSKTFKKPVQEKQDQSAGDSGFQPSQKDGEDPPQPNAGSQNSSFQKPKPAPAADPPFENGSKNGEPPFEKKNDTENGSGESANESPLRLPALQFEEKVAGGIPFQRSALGQPSAPGSPQVTRQRFRIDADRSPSTEKPTIVQK